MINKISLIAICVTLSACATTAKFEKRMDSKKGMTKSELIEDMGIPDRTYKADDFEIVEYNQSNSFSVPSTSISTVTNNQVYTTTPTYGSRTVSCKLEFKVVNNIVTNYRYKGDMCISK